MKPEILRLALLLAFIPLCHAQTAEPAAPGPAADTKAGPQAAPAEAKPKPTERLAADAAVFAAADPKAPVLARLKAGASITPVAGESPIGWRRVELSGPFEAYAHTRDITKGLTVREGAKIHAAPRADAPVLTTAAEDDKTDVIGLAGGDWCQIKLEKTLVGFIAIGETANLAPAAPRPTASAPTRPSDPGAVTAAGRPAQFAGNTADLPRIFQGQLSTAATLLNRNPPYDYQLTDAAGKRIAYLDLRRVVLNARLESLVGRSITLTGTLRNTVDGKDLVIAAETLQAK